jgi:hypothetical protein
MFAIYFGTTLIGHTAASTDAAVTSFMRQMPTLVWAEMQARGYSAERLPS